MVYVMWDAFVFIVLPLDKLSVVLRCVQTSKVCSADVRGVYPPQLNRIIFIFYPADMVLSVILITIAINQMNSNY